MSDYSVLRDERVPLEDAYKKALETLGREASDIKCPDCKGRTIGSKENLGYYEHSGGQEVNGIKLWLYFRCPKCRYSWALWKVG